MDLAQEVGEAVAFVRREFRENEIDVAEFLAIARIVGAETKARERFGAEVFDGGF